VAGLLQEGAQGAETVVCVITGHGLKDPENAIAHAPPPTPVEPTIDAVRRALDL